MAGTAAQRKWLQTVLGVDLAGGAGAGPRSGAKLLPIWVDAKDEVDAGLNRLAAVLRDYEDPDLEQIAEYGLNGLTDKRSVGLMVALREADAGTAGAQAKVRAAVQAFRSFLDSDPTVELIDDNPFDVAIDLRGTLGRALDELATLSAH